MGPRQRPHLQHRIGPEPSQPKTKLKTGLSQNQTQIGPSLSPSPTRLHLLPSFPPNVTLRESLHHRRQDGERSHGGGSAATRRRIRQGG